LAKDICRNLGLSHKTLDFGYEDFHSAMSGFADKFVELPDNVFGTLPKGYPALDGYLDGKHLWLGTEPFSAYSYPASIDSGGLPEDEPALNVTGERFRFLEKALAPNRTVPPSLLAQIVTGSSLPLLAEAGATLNGLFTSRPGAELFAEFTHKFRFKLWNFSRGIYEQRAVVITPLHSFKLLEAYLKFPGPRRIDKAAFRDSNHFGLAADFPLHSKGVSFDYFDWLRHDETALSVMRGSIERSGMIDGLLDGESFAEIMSPEVLTHNAVVLVIIRLYLLSLTTLRI
jgi:hypothetical protein